MRRITLLFFFGLIAEFSFACNICHVYMGLRPNDFKHHIGLNYRNRILRGQLPVNVKSARGLMLKHDEVIPVGTDPDTRYIPVDESYQVVELTGRYRLTERWALRASLPYLISTSRINNEMYAQVNDLGDPWLMLERRIINSKKDEEERVLNHRLTSGFGVKLPLGKTTKRFNDESIPFDMQPGSGSYDLLGSLEYVLRWRSIGFSGAGVYKYNGKNLSEYRFGNTAQINANLFVLKQLKKMYFMPSMGWYHEMAGKDNYRNNQLEETGGELSFIGVAMEIGYKNISFQMGLQENVHDHLKNSIAPAKRRITAGFNYYIK